MRRRTVALYSERPVRRRLGCADTQRVRASLANGGQGGGTRQSGCVRNGVFATQEQGPLPAMWSSDMTERFGFAQRQHNTVWYRKTAPPPPFGRWRWGHGKPTEEHRCEKKVRTNTV